MPEEQEQPLRCGVVQYANAMPLWHRLRQQPALHLTIDVPGRLAALLQRRELDVGLLPVIEYFRQPETTIVAGIGVSARRAVRSVRIFHRVPLSQVRRVRLDASSRTSSALSQVILRDLYGLSPEFTFGPVPERDLSSLPEDAALIIGDPCLHALLRAEWDSIDLAESWYQLTGRPFVFAAWLVGKWIPPNRARRLVEVLQAACREGEAMLPEIARISAAETGLDRFQLLDYLRQNIRYRLGEDEVAGLAEFSRRAAALGLCEQRAIELAGGDA